jgi:hypothetical protein
MSRPYRESGTARSAVRSDRLPAEWAEGARIQGFAVIRRFRKESE